VSVFVCVVEGGDVDDIMAAAFVGGYCSTLQGLLDWFEVDLGFTERCRRCHGCW